MKRDMDLVRGILMEIEKQPYTSGPVDIHLDGPSDEEFFYHVMILNEAGLIEAFKFSTLGRVDWRPVRLTWSGHEFLEASRDDTRWEKAKTVMADKGGGMIFDVLKQLLVKLASANVLGS